MYEIAVLMTCHNRKEKTIKCLKHLFDQNEVNINFRLWVYLVDDGSSDGTSLAISTSFPEINLINGDGNLFWNRGMYLAWKTAAEKNYDFYLWLNDDTYLYNYAIHEMLSAMKTIKNKAIISGCIESPVHKGEITYGGIKFKKNGYTINYPNGKLNICDQINGNCVLIPDFVYKKVGNLDWSFNHAIGDHDYGLRAKKLGISSYTTPIFIAECAKDNNVPRWRLPHTNIKDRIKNLYSPLSYSHPNEFFIFERRHFGFFVALKHYFSIHLRVVFPHFWKQKSHNN